MIVRIILIVQKEYLLVKPARDAAIIAKLEAEALSVPEGPLHTDNEWNIRWVLGWYSGVYTTIYRSIACKWNIFRVQTMLKYDHMQVLWSTNCFRREVRHVLTRVLFLHYLFIMRFSFLFCGAEATCSLVVLWCFFSVVDDSAPERTDATSSGDIYCYMTFRCNNAIHTTKTRIDGKKFQAIRLVEPANNFHISHVIGWLTIFLVIFYCEIALLYQHLVLISL